MSKQRRTVLSSLVSPIATAPEPVAAFEQENAIPAARRSATKAATIQQTNYLPPSVHEQLRELAHVERVKMHDLTMEGLDLFFKKRCLKSIAELTGKS